MSFDTQNYIELFYQDADEHLQIMTDSLLDLEKNPEDKEALSACFRSAHTMKSSSAMVGFMHISEFTHRMEDLIGLMQNGEVPIDSEKVDLLFHAFDVLKEMLAQLQDETTEAEKNKTKSRSRELINTFQTLMDGGESSEREQVSIKHARVRLSAEHREKLEDMRLAGEEIYEITITFDSEVQMASARAYLIINNLSQIATVVHTDPDLNDENEELYGELALIAASTQPVEQLKKRCLVSEIHSVEVRDVTQIEQFEWDESGTKEASQLAAEKLGESILEGSEEQKLDEEKVVTSFDRREDRMKMQTVRVNIEKLDKLLNLAAELVIQRGRAYELAQRLVGKHGKGGVEEELMDAITQQGMYLTQLQETVMDSRMVPIGSVFSRFRRVVRDLANQRDKKVNLVIEGEETELDKKIIDQIGDPLMHMVRNSIDHGLEDGEDRKRAGKPAEGLLHLNAIHQGNSIVITIQDDGKGIDPDILRKKAVEKGLLSSEEAAALSDNEALKLIFKSGFSTAKEVTDISGRGVGMDVVRKSIESLGGSVDIQTELGKGTTFYLKLPLTLAIIQALLVESGKELYALPIMTVSETIRINKSDIYRVKGQGNVIRLREEIVPILNLSNVIQAEHEIEDTGRYYVAILRSGSNYAGLIVDRMVNEQEIVIKPLSSDMKHAPYVAGASILGDGRVILILDTASLIETTLGSAA